MDEFRQNGVAQSIECPNKLRIGSFLDIKPMIAAGSLLDPYPTDFSIPRTWSFWVLAGALALSGHGVSQDGATPSCILWIGNMVIN